MAGVEADAPPAAKADRKTWHHMITPRVPQKRRIDTDRPRSDLYTIHSYILIFLQIFIYVLCVIDEFSQSIRGGCEGPGVNSPGLPVLALGREVDDTGI